MPILEPAQAMCPTESFFGVYTYVQSRGSGARLMRGVSARYSDMHSEPPARLGVELIKGKHI